MLYITKKFYHDLKADDPFAAIMQLDGQVYRHVKTRKTIRFTLNNTTYYAKLFYGTSVWEIVKNLLKGQSPVIGADYERRALKKLAALGIKVPELIAFGGRGWNPLRRQSFVVMEAIEPAISLEDYVREWPEKPLGERRALIAKVAQISRMMHEHGIQHRDFYICHFLLKNNDLTLIDLHRARTKNPLPLRWRLKDLSALLFSVMEVPLTRHDYWRFMRNYSGQSLRVTLVDPLWKRVENRAISLYKKLRGIEPLYLSTMNNKMVDKKKYLVNQRFFQQARVAKNDASPELLNLLNNPESIFTRSDVILIKQSPLCTLARIKVADKDLVVKRYRWRNGWHGFTRLFRPSRAARCWSYAQILAQYNIPTPKPIALIEKRCGILRLDAYYITEYCEGSSLRDFLRSKPESSVLQRLQKNWQDIHQLLTFARLSHGDTNHQNFLMTKKGLMILDLDTMRYHFFSHRLSYRKDRDNQRFLREWKKYAEQNEHI